MNLRIGAGPLALLTVTLALGCSVGDSGGGFSSGLTIGSGPADGGPGGLDESGGTGMADGESGVGTGNADGSTGGGGVDGPTCTPSDEICDGLDNDCDGEVDNDDPEGGAPCDTGMPGNCEDGTTRCEGGEVVCVPDMAAMAEACNGLDDDCNGQVDDGNPEGGAPCNTGMPGACADGISECMVGVLACNPMVMPSTETCDNIDNDCNGQIDDGNPGGGGACATGMPGICSAGTNQCNGGALSCQQNQMAAPSDLCTNGLDDDCNGQVDDGCGSNCDHDVCVEGVPLAVGCDPCVNQVCGFDPWCCSISWDGLCVDNVGPLCGIVC